LILNAAIFFGVIAIGTSLAALVRGAITARIWVALPVGLVLIGAATTVASLIGVGAVAANEFAVITVIAIALSRLWQRRWSWLGAQLFATGVLSAGAYLAYAGEVTFGSAHTLIYLVASTVLLFLEVAALGLSASYLFEIVDSLSRRPRPVHAGDPSYLPKIAIQVPAYNEPMEVVSETLKSLAAIDYPGLIVQVVDNNTPDEAGWRALEKLCQELGPRFQFMHLENWPGFKAGALNEANRRLPSDVEIVGVVDSDYVVEKEWPRSVVHHFADPKVAFVQTPQNYRDWSDDQYLRGLYYSYQYFFEISMPARQNRNAIIFAGTMGLIRLSVLREIGGWNADIVTEDAEASLRMLDRGYRGVYEPQAFGAGLMPLSFDGLKKQRFRWALGGMQILRVHWKRLLGGGGRLTLAQRIYYLLGSIQWFGDPLMLCFTLLLLATATATAFHHQLPVRSFAGAVLGLPVAFLVTGLLRAVWAMKVKTRCTWRDAIAGLQVWFALSWVVSLACIRGLLRFKTAFLRTPKEKEGRATWFEVLRSAQVEVLLAAAGFVAAAVMLIRAPSIATGALSFLLLFQASVYANAPWASASAEGIHLTPLRSAYRRSAQNTGARPALGAQLLGVPLVGALVILAIVLIAALATPPPNVGPVINLNPQNPAPAQSPAPSTTPSATPSPSASPSESPSASPSVSPSPSPSPSAS
jgi:cellulose synthase/poly-beta-1,6-N-acetylglucosamine synthase-like glycosyltransferase